MRLDDGPGQVSVETLLNTVELDSTQTAQHSGDGAVASAAFPGFNSSGSSGNNVYGYGRRLLMNNNPASSSVAGRLFQRGQSQTAPATATDYNPSSAPHYNPSCSPGDDRHQQHLQQREPGGPLAEGEEGDQQLTIQEFRRTEFVSWFVNEDFSQFTPDYFCITDITHITRMGTGLWVWYCVIGGYFTLHRVPIVVVVGIVVSAGFLFQANYIFLYVFLLSL
jgi:hypothetical protein